MDRLLSWKPHNESLDIFNATVMDRFDVVASGRLGRHFEYPDRRRVCQGVSRSLARGWHRHGGCAGVREKVGSEKFGADDVFWSRSSFRDELGQNGFQLTRFEPAGPNI